MPTAAKPLPKATPRKGWRPRAEPLPCDPRDPRQTSLLDLMDEEGPVRLPDRETENDGYIGLGRR
jgi:hypothetical protein